MDGELQYAMGDGQAAAGAIDEEDLMVGYGNETEYEIDEIAASKGSGAAKRFHVRWKGWEGQPNEWTWEPRENLTMSDGCRKMLADFEKGEAGGRKRKMSSSTADPDANEEGKEPEDHPNVERMRERWYVDVGSILKEKACLV